MKLRHLALLALANLLVAAGLAVSHPHGSELARLKSVLHFSMDRDDSSRFLGAACTVGAAGKPVYRELFFGQGFKFLYPPASLFTCGLAASFGLRLAALINALALASVPVTLALNAELFLLLCPAATERRRWWIRALVASLGILFAPLLYAVYLGQIQALLDLLFTVAVWGWVRGNKAIPGIAVALICCFKPPLAFFFLWALLRREWRFLACFAGASTIFQGLALWRFGWTNAADYLHVLTFLSHHGEALADNQSVNGFLERWTGNGVGVDWTSTSPYPAYNRLVYAGTLASWILLLGFGLVWPLLRRWQDRATDFLIFGLLATVSSPIAWTHHYGIFFLGSIYALALTLRQQSRIPWPLAVCFLVLANTWRILDPLAGTRWNPLLSYDLYAGLAMIGWLVFACRPQEYHRALVKWQS